MFLVFESSNLPYAEVITYLLANVEKKLKVGLASLDAVNPLVLHILPTEEDATKKMLIGKCSVSRYFARIASKPLYSSLSLPNQIIVDDILDNVRNGRISEVLKVINASNGNYILGSEISLADIIAYDYFKVNPQQKTSEAFNKWFSKIDSLPEAVEAAKIIKNSLSTADVNDIFKIKIAEQLSTLSGAEKKTIFTLLTPPAKPEYGDYSIPVARLRLQGNPVQLAKEFSEKFQINEYITATNSIGMFLNFTISRDKLRDILIPRVLSLNDNYGINASGAGKVSVVEFSSPNIAKPFHAGHLRSTIIGNFVQNVLKANGHKTIGINYLGDWGKQYGLLAVGYKKYGNDEELEKDPIKHLFHVYVSVNRDASENPAVHDEARAYFKKMEDGDEEALALWSKFRNLSIVKYKEIYGRLNVNFDVYSGESMFSAGMIEVLNQLKELNLLELSEGAQIVNLKPYKLGAAIIAKTDGTTLYITRDIAAAISRYRAYKFDSMYYIVGAQQDHHFRQLFKILELMGMPWASQCHHINFGLVKSKDGQMSTRKGTVVFLEEILDATKNEMHDVMKKNEAKYKQIEDPEYVSDVVGMSAVMVQDMMARRIKDYELDWNRMLSFEGDTGPYLQYAHARLCSLARNQSQYVIDENTDISCLTEKEAKDLINLISQYPELVKSLPAQLEPCMVVSYCMKLAHAVSQALEALWVQGQEEKVAKARLALYACARITLHNALSILGIRPLEKM